MVGRDAVGECEADAVALRFRREEGDEDAPQVVFGDAGSGVFNLDLRPRAPLRVALARATDSHASLRLLFGYGLRRVAHEVEQSLSKHPLVGVNVCELALDGERDAPLVEERSEVCGALPDEFVQ